MQDGERQPVVGQEHVGTNHGEVRVVLLQGDGTVAHVVMGGHLQPDVFVIAHERLGISLDQGGLGAVARPDGDGENGGA